MLIVIFPIAINTTIVEYMGKTAIIIGATGATGNHLLRLLLLDKRYDSIKLFSRSSCKINHPKIKEYLGNLFELEKQIEEFTADEVFCCIGTTKKQTPDESIYRKIDFGIPVTAAKIAKQNKIPKFLVMSSMGANSKSNAFYTRTKGEMEESISNFKIASTYIFRPSLLIRNSKETRILESIGASFMKATNFLFLGSLKKYRAIKTITVASAMIEVANSKLESSLFLSDEIQKLGA